MLNMYVPQKIPTQGIANYTLGNYNIDSHIVKNGFNFLSMVPVKYNIFSMVPGKYKVFDYLWTILSSLRVGVIILTMVLSFYH